MNKDFLYQEQYPHPLLKDYVECFWRFEKFQGKPQIFTILPDGCFDLLYLFKDKKNISVKLTGLWESRSDISYFDAITIVGIRFKPASINYIVKFPVSSIINSSLSLYDREIGLSKDLVENCFNSGFSALVNLFEQHFLKLMIRNIPGEESIILKRIEETSGTKSIESLSNSIGISSRQLQRKINSLIGMGPKKYIKIIRFKHYLENADNHFYYDQSHLYKDFKNICSCTPMEMKNDSNVRFLQYNKFFLS